MTNERIREIPNRDEKCWKDLNFLRSKKTRPSSAILTSGVTLGQISTFCDSSYSLVVMNCIIPEHRVSTFTALRRSIIGIIAERVCLSVSDTVCLSVSL